MSHPIRRLLALVAASLVVPFAAAGAQTDAEAEREQVQRDRAAVASDVEDLREDQAVAEEDLDRITTSVAEQQRIVEEARASVAAAERAAAEAEAELAVARADVEELRLAIRDMAVAAYIHQPLADAVHALATEDLAQTIHQQTYLNARADRDFALLDRMTEAEARAANRAAALADATEQARQAAIDADAALTRLQEQQAAQRRTADGLADQLDRRLAEAAALADLDASLAAQIRAESAALAEKLAAVPPAPPSTGGSGSGGSGGSDSGSGGSGGSDSGSGSGGSDSGSGGSGSGGSGSGSGGSGSGSGGSGSGGSDSGSGSGGSGSGGSGSGGSGSGGSGGSSSGAVDCSALASQAPPLQTVRGFTVHADIASNVAAMIDAANAAGHALGGGAYRSMARQCELRIAHCGGNTYYNVWEKPSGSCNPPTARPGRSMHEQGKALDLTTHGSLIRSRSNAAFQWLAANAGRYGLINLPSEPWHWSTNGN